MAQVIRYVDPDATGAGDGTSWTDAYTSLGAWEAAEQTNLVTAGDYHTVYCRSSGGTADTTHCTISGWTTGAANYIEIIGNDFPADGIYDATKYRLEVTNDTWGILRIEEDFVRLSNLQISVIVTATGYGIATYNTTAGSDIRIDSCIVKGICSGTGAGYGFYISGAGTNIKIYNCTVYDFVSGANINFLGIYCYYAASIEIYNTTVYNCYDGIVRNLAGPYIVTNCAVGNCNNDFSSSGLTIDYCISDDGDGTNAQGPLDGDWTKEFTDAANGDFSLLPDGNCIGNGTNDPGSGLYSDDIIGTARS